MSAPAWLEIVGAGLGFVYVVLVIRQKVGCWPVGILSALVYVLVFFQARLYGQAGLQCVYIALMAYGWWEWRRGGAGGGPLAVSRLPARWWAGVLLGGVSLSVAIGLLLARRTDAALPFWDGGTTAWSLLAQWMTARKWIENWAVWIAVNVVYVGMYASQHLYPTTLLYGAFLALAVLGLLEWRRAMRPAPGSSPERA
jgi:nicotinamide mononucleotide transporter